jgi:transcriptional regulator with XRE-family HTH domain
MPETFPEAVRRLAAERGLSLSELARRAGLNRAHLQHLLSDPPRRTPTLASARKVALGLGVSLDVFDPQPRRSEAPNGDAE